MKWHILPAPPNDSTRLVGVRPAGFDPSTPAEVRQLYSAKVKPLDLALWQVDQLFGLKSGIDERVLRGNGEWRWILGATRSAKGSGSVSLSVLRPRKAETMILHSRLHRGLELRWFSALAEAMRSQFGFQVDFVDHGYDA